MLEVVTYNFGIWNGRVTPEHLEGLWRTMDNMAGMGEETLTRLFPNGWLASHFMSDEARAKFVDPTLICDFNFWGHLSCPKLFTVDMDFLLEMLTEDPSLIYDWGDFNVLAGQFALDGGDDVVTAVGLEPWVPVQSFDSWIAYEIEQAGWEDTFGDVGQDIIPDLLRVHGQDFRDHDALPHNGPRQKGVQGLGFLIYDGLSLWDITGGQTGGGYWDPPDYYVELSYEGLLNYKSLRIVKDMSMADQKTVRTSVAMDLVRPGHDGHELVRSILD